MELDRIARENDEKIPQYIYHDPTSSAPSIPLSVTRAVLQSSPRGSSSRSLSRRRRCCHHHRRRRPTSTERATGLNNCPTPPTRSSSSIIITTTTTTTTKHRGGSLMTISKATRCQRMPHQPRMGELGAPSRSQMDKTEVCCIVGGARARRRKTPSRCLGTMVGMPLARGCLQHTQGRPL
jgi:hypothetical protein